MGMGTAYGRNWHRSFRRTTSNADITMSTSYTNLPYGPSKSVRVASPLETDTGGMVKRGLTFSSFMKTRRTSHVTSVVLHI
jgi:hypothetical protein